MPQKRKEESEFKVSDRRLFTTDGELRESSEESAPPVATATAEPVASATEKAGESSVRSATSATTAGSAATASSAAHDSEIPAQPSASEQKAQHDAYQQSTRDLDSQVERSGHSAKDLEITFERFMASLYMTAMMQLGMMHEQGGQPGVDLIGARQTIDTLSMISEKTKGNLTPKEQAFLQNCLYELRMAYVEVMNALARAPQASGPVTGTNG